MKYLHFYLALCVFVLTTIIILCNKKKPEQTILQCDSKELPATFGKKPLGAGPAGKAILYLNFYGGVVSGTSWNVSGDIVYDSAGISGPDIANIFNQVSHYYDSVNITVTLDKKLYDRTKEANRQMMIFTKTNEWYGNGAGGTTFIGSYGTTPSTPGFVFTKLLNYDVPKIGRVAGHESGHTFGLYHQAWYDSCTYLGDYRPDVLMGNALINPNCWWTVGPNAGGCTYIQYDLEKIASVVGWKL